MSANVSLDGSPGRNRGKTRRISDQIGTKISHHKSTISAGADHGVVRRDCSTMAGTARTNEARLLYGSLGDQRAPEATTQASGQRASYTFGSRMPRSAMICRTRFG